MYMRRVHHLPTHLYICLSIHPSLSFCTIHGKSSPTWKLTLCPGQLLQPPVSFIMEAPEQWQLPQRKPYLVVDGDFWVYTDGLNVHYEVIQSGNSAFSWFYRMTGIIYSIYTVYIYIHGILCNIYICMHIHLWGRVASDGQPGPPTSPRLKVYLEKIQGGDASGPLQVSIAHSCFSGWLRCDLEQDFIGQAEPNS